MKRPWNVVGAGFNDEGVYFTFDDTTIHRADVRLMEAAPDLLEALQEVIKHLVTEELDMTVEEESAHNMARAAINKALGEK